MPRFRSLILLTLSTSAAAADSALTGEWLLGHPSPAAVYDGAYSGAVADTTRLLLRPDGLYTLTDIDFTYIPGYFGAYLITCGTITVTTESGRYGRSGEQVTFTPTHARKVSGLSPQTLNSGCQRFGGEVTSMTVKPYRGTVSLRGTQLTVNVGGTRRAYVSRAEAQAAAAAEDAAMATSMAEASAAGGPVTPTRTPPPVGGPAAAAPWSATGEWHATLDIPGQRVTLALRLYDDGQDSLSGSAFAGSQRVAWVLGSRQGTFSIGLETDSGDVTLRVTGQFRADQFDGTFRASDDRGADLGSGTVTMQRPK